MTKVFVVADDYGAVRGVYSTAEGMLKALVEVLEETWDEDWDGMTAAEYAMSEYRRFADTNKGKNLVEYFSVDYCTVSVCDLD